MVKASASRVVDLGSVPTFAVDLFPDRVIPVTSKCVLQGLSCQVSVVVMSSLGLVGQVSVYCDSVR